MAGNRLNYLTADDWVLIQAKAVPQTYKLGDEIIREGGWGDSIYIIRRGEASVELAGTGSRTIVADLGPGDVCGEMAFIEQAKASAAVIAKSEEVQADQISARALAEILEAFPRLSSRFYRSLALVLVQRLRVTTGELAREMALRDRHRSGIPSPFSKDRTGKDEKCRLTNPHATCSITWISLPFGAGGISCRVAEGRAL